jgi:hypothetical protein
LAEPAAPPVTPVPARKRRLLRHLALTLFLSFIAWLGVGWAVTRQHDFCFRWLGWNTTTRLSDWYRTAALHLLPGDADGDGVPDGAELYWGSNPRNSNDHPGLDAALTDRYYDILFCGQRKNLRWRVNALSETVPVAHGFRLRFTADEPVLLREASVGDDPIAGPITVTVDQWGAFDIDVRADVPDREQRIQIDNARTGEKVREMCITVVGYPMPSLRPRVLPPNGPNSPPELLHDFAPDRQILRWKAPDYPVDGYVAEAARAEPGAPWKAFRWCGPETTECRATHTAASLFGQPDGPLKWRIVPYRNTKPEAEDL